MEHVEKALSRVSIRHRQALIWFSVNVGVETPWPEPLQTSEGKTFLATKAKGIYKPSWSDYALSVRQSIGSKYPDRELMIRPDGSWLYSYFQENDDISARDAEYTNRGLMRCIKDGVPVGVLRQVSAAPNTRYRVLGLALVSGWDGGYFFLEGFSRNGFVRPRGPAGELELISIAEERRSVENGEFDPTGTVDARERALRQIVLRRGQPVFRRILLEAYDGKCAFSGCDAPDALEAAHILPYRGPDTDHVKNGLLLRSDLHTLFDLGLISIDPSTMLIVLAASLATTTYAQFAGKRIRLPHDSNLHPSPEALTDRFRWCGLSD